ncbi:50S ribosomal protein L3 [Anatilimnocola floriformis]|uniref:50S ribosomal protein L3 n=1 Tax=Anatilimnocola floriformis TaxID=2948575 RepID=UPI0020C2944F|nr:50S ribosomal protein L3 [Anatilimnocola floriformis]
MTKGILGRKVGMTQIFDESGACLPVTVVLAGPCRVLQVRTADKDGYEAVQLGFLDKPRRLASRSESGHVADISSRRSAKLKAAGVAVPAKANCEPQRFVRELRGAAAGLAVGATVDVSAMEGVKTVDVTGNTKGRGFTGAMKRWNFAGQRATHGVKKVHRHMGGTGALAANRGGGRMKKGKHMPGRYGNERVTIRNMRLVKVDKEKNLLLIYGAVPGPPGQMLVIRESNYKS